MQMLENYLFFDTLNVVTIKVRIHFFCKAIYTIQNKIIELNKLFFNVCISWL